MPDAVELIFYPADDYDKKYEAFLNRFLKSKPISNKINDLFGKELP